MDIMYWIYEGFSNILTMNKVVGLGSRREMHKCNTEQAKKCVEYSWTVCSSDRLGREI